jgi:predicted DNA-binding WGR domain protein
LTNEDVATGPETGASSGFAEFEFRQGTSDKCSKIAVAGSDVTVAYGCRGIKGNSGVKTYETAESVGCEAGKLTWKKR